MVQTVKANAGWDLEVERGPAWLFVKVHPDGNSYFDAPDMADRLWRILSKHFTYRLVLEMDEVSMLPSHMMGQLVMLQKRVCQQGGALRICHLRPECREAMHIARLDTILPNYESRAEAVQGMIGMKPR